ncbi:50S ribosomal protein L33 [Heyndrickxia sporothermodurans]
MQRKIVLACAQCGSRNYSTFHNKQTDTERLEVKKFCKHCNSHIVHRETK